MNSIRFAKYEALGNDFILIDESQDKKRNIEPSTSISLRRALCERKSGIGADGVITLLVSPHADAHVFMHLTNADGSVAENCGNGLRCVARWLLDSSRVEPDQEFKIDTLSGLKKTTIIGDQIRIELGRAKIAALAEPSEIAKEATLFASSNDTNAPTSLAFVTIGNPHLIMQTDHPDLAQTQLGPRLEKLKMFPKGANVSFVNVLGPDRVALRVWERGAGATDACGSGAAASVSALVVHKIIKPDTSVSVQFRNGVLKVAAHPKSDFELDVEICGSARKCFEGIWED